MHPAESLFVWLCSDCKWTGSEKNKLSFSSVSFQRFWLKVSKKFWLSFTALNYNWCCNRVWLSLSSTVCLELASLGRRRKAVDEPSLWRCLWSLLKQQQSELLAQCSDHFSLLFTLPRSGSHFFTHSAAFASFLSSCRRGKPLTGWPRRLSASQPCQSSSGSSHAVPVLLVPAEVEPINKFKGPRQVGMTLTVFHHTKSRLTVKLLTMLTPFDWCIPIQKWALHLRED